LAPSDGISFGKYQLLERLAVGGMAEIWRARLTGAAGITKPCVIKKVLPELARDPGFTAMFIQEAAVTVGLSHGNIAQVFDFGEVDGEYYLAMEHVHGQPLSAVLRRARTRGLPVLPPPLALMIGVEMARGLHHAHTRLDEHGRPLHVIHRDVSPQNVVLSYEGQVKLVDFGIAKARTAGRQATEAGAVKGKYVYFAPEQVRGLPLDARVDVFATGVVLYEMLCGRLPFEGPMTEVLRRIAQGHYPPPRQLQPDLPVSLERVLCAALATEREHRPASAQALGEALSAELYALAPPLPGDALGHLMAALFEQELHAEGRPATPLPRELLALLERTRRPPRPAAAPAASSASSASSAVVPAPPDEEETPTLENTPLEGLPHAPPGLAPPRGTAILSAPAPRGRPVWSVALPAAVALAAGAGVVALLLPSTTEVSLTSEPPGATVVVDGRRAPTRTPVLIRNLRADRAHRLELRAPGRAPWVWELPPSEEARQRLHATLLPALPGGARFPAAPFRVDATEHGLRLPTASTLRLALDPARRYRVRLEAAATLPVVFLAEGAPPGEAPLPAPAPARAALADVLGTAEAPAPCPGVLTAAPTPLPPGGRALWLLRLDGAPLPALVHLEDERGVAEVHPLATGATPEEGFPLSGLTPHTRYRVTARAAAGEAGEEAGAEEAGAEEAAPGCLVVLSGPEAGREAPAVQVLAEDRPVLLEQAAWARFLFLDLRAQPSPGPAPGALRVDVREAPLALGAGP
jgi:serine/threonine protein kinase